jgi:hypothetical protein
MKNKLMWLMLVLILPLSGCGIISLGYNYADAYLRYSINSYTSYNDQQKDTIHREVDAYMAWHRATMLPKYVAFLQEVQRTAQSGAPLSKDAVAHFRAEVRALYVQTLQPTIKPAAKLLSTLNEAQIDELEKSFAKEINKLKAKELSGNTEEQLRKRTERSVDFLENLVGGFNDGQLDKIRLMNRNLPFATPLYIAQREDYQAHLLEVLKDRQGAAAIDEVLDAWLHTPEKFRNAADQSLVLAFEQGSDEMIASVYQLLTERQRKALLKNIQKYINTFQDLATSK